MEKMLMQKGFKYKWITLSWQHLGVQIPLHLDNLLNYNTLTKEIQTND